MFIVERYPKSIEVEAFRSLRTNIQYTNVDKKMKVITISSCTSGEGKTTVAGNLALVLAENKKRILLIDCDLRRPRIHKYFNISNMCGLTDLLIGAIEFENARFVHKSGLNILPAGKVPPNPSQLLNSNAMKNLLKVLRNIYDYIIIDTPPVGVIADGKVLGGQSDGTILVAKVNKTKKDSLLSIKKELEKLNIHIMGSVLNGISKKNGELLYFYEDKEMKRKEKRGE